MIRLNLAIGTCIVANALLPTITACAATYYVAITGSDANTCVQAQTATRAKQTIPAGVACLRGGDTLIVKAGTYLNQEITDPPAGSSSSYTIIKADPAGARPVIIPNGSNYQRGFYCSKGSACHHIEVRGFEITKAYNSVKLYGDSTLGFPHHVSLIDNILHDTVHTNVLICSSFTGFEGGDHLIQNNTFYNTGVGNPGYKPGHNTIYNTGNRTIVEKNEFHNLANGVGIWSQGILVQNVIIRSNVFYDIGRTSIDAWQRGNGSFSAIHVSVPGGGHKIYNNIIYRSGDEPSFNGIKVWKANASDINYIYNNTIYDIKHPSAPAIRIVPAAGQHLIKNNIAYLGGAGIIGGTQSNNLTDDPSFANPANANFSLQRRSPAIDAGVATVPTDFAGISRPQGAGYDIGAYEAGSGNAPLAPTGLSAN